MTFWGVLGPAIGLVVVIAVWVARPSRRYRKMFSDAHFREVHERFARAIETVEAGFRASGASGGDAHAEDAFVTSGQLVIIVTLSAMDGGQVLHVSISQSSGPTTTAVAQRVGLFLVTILNRNKMKLDPFVTPSRVHHLVFAYDGTPLEVSDVERAIDQYRTGYRPLPFRAESLAGAGERA